MKNPLFARNIPLLSFALVLLLHLAGCRHRDVRPTQESNSIQSKADAEQIRLLAELKALLPFSLGAQAGTLPTSTYVDRASNLMMHPGTRKDEPDTLYFLLVGKFDGLLKVTLRDGKVSGAYFAWGTQATGLLTPFRSVF